MTFFDAFSSSEGACPASAPTPLPLQALHGGADAQGQPAHDFSTNANAAGPCPEVVARLRAVDATHYPDPAYTALVARLAAHEGVPPERIVLAASASEAISRLTAAVRLLQPHAQVFVPPRAYGDYARAAAAWQLPRTSQPAQAQLLWQCEPSSPDGLLAPELPALLAALRADQTLVLDLAYAPLRLDGPDRWLGHQGRAEAPLARATPAAMAAGTCATPPQAPWAGRLAPARPPAGSPQPAPVMANGVDHAVARHRVWRMVTPNKALGLTGIRAAYLIAPQAALTPDSMAARVRERLMQLAPSWPVGSHGVCLLQAWCDPVVQAWLHTAKGELRQWRTRQWERLARMGWRVQPSLAPFGLAQPPVPAQQLPELLGFFRARGVKLRDATSLGAPGWLRLGVRSPADQEALQAAWQAWAQRHTPEPVGPGPSPAADGAPTCAVHAPRGAADWPNSP